MKRTRKSGVTLIEVLFAMFLVMACALIVAATMPIADVARGKADLMSKATGMAQKQLEAIRGVGYANINPASLASYGLIDSTTPIASNTYSFTNSDSANLDNPSRILPQGAGSVKVESVQTNLVRVTITVTYNDNQRNQSVTLGTLVANL
ncbi:MAG: type IV pilus modification PilV family protein [Fimbriimonadaceae bacterium]